MTWESSRGQSGGSGLLVCYGLDETSGALAAPLPWGDAGAHSHVTDVARSTLATLETVWPGVTPEWNGLATLSVPFLDPNLNGSYSYYRVGQYQAFGGYEAVRQRNVHFAGEHTSTEFQGFMEGAAAEGVRAARALLADLRPAKRPPPKARRHDRPAGVGARCARARPTGRIVRCGRTPAWLNRGARDRLAALARHLADGVSTNDQFEDRAEPVVEASRGDRAVHVILRDAAVAVAPTSRSTRLRDDHVGSMSERKIVPLARAAALVADGDHITIGGVMLHRIPAAFVRELARQRRRNLRLSKPSPSYDLDLLCAAGCLAEVDAGVASLESAFGGALPNYRRAVEAGLLRVREFS